MRWSRFGFSLTNWIGCSLALFMFLPPILHAQEERNLEETLNMLSGDAASAYLAPISSAIGSNLNSGWFHRAPKAEKLGFGLEVGLVMMGSFFPEDADHFSVTGRFRFSSEEANTMLEYWERQPDAPDLSNPALRSYLIAQITGQVNQVGISGATVVGAATDSVRIAYRGATYSFGGQEYSVPEQDLALPFGGFGDLAEVSIMPLAAPQLTVGTIQGTQFTLRFLPAVELDKDLGELKYLGFGIQHNPAVWFDMKLPVDVAASLFTQTLKVGDLFESKTFAFGVNASKTLGWRFLNLTPYAGLMFEDAKMTASYDFVVETPEGTFIEPVSIELQSDNTMRLTLGLNARLGIVNWNVDYSLAAYSAISTGLSLAF